MPIDVLDQEKADYILELARQARQKEIADMVEEEKQRLLDGALSDEDKELLRKNLQFTVKTSMWKKGIKSMDEEAKSSRLRRRRPARRKAFPKRISQRCRRRWKRSWP